MVEKDKHSDSYLTYTYLDETINYDCFPYLVKIIMDWSCNFQIFLDERVVYYLIAYNEATKGATKNIKICSLLPRCTKLVDEQSFATGIAHLRVENAGQIRLGPHALRSRGLQQLESITITDTKIIELNQTAFDGITYLFAVNLTRNGLREINPNIFQNNTQLTLLAISGNPLKHAQDSKLSKHSLFDAPSVTEFDFSYNGLTKLKRTAFSKMPSLIYVNLKNNKLKEVDSVTFSSLESLVEIDLSNNLLDEIPTDLFSNKGVQTLRVAGTIFGVS